MTPAGVRGVVVDSSAVVSLLARESHWEQISEALVSAPLRLMSAGTLVELGIVLSRMFPQAAADASRALVRDLELTLVDVDETHALAAIEAWRAFGRGNHPAKLNYGDCFTYATASIAGLPILCIGNDFSRTGAGVVSLAG